MTDEIVGATGGLKWVMERVDLVAPLDVPVLLLGKTGTGKEVISRAIHVRSPRSQGPFLRVNCGAIPSELIDSQLFGHEKGSFTGAGESRQGWFERASGGTLFLDEIGELPLAAQVRLLRVLQDHQFERVGGQHPVAIDVRIVAATHRDLASMVREKSFREDLWFRINTFPILIPSLQERTADMPELARHFVKRAANRFGLPIVTLTDRDLELLSAYDWPGNIRELQAVIDRAVILGNGRSLEIGKSLGISQEPHRQSPVATKATVSATSELHSTSSFGLTAENEPFISLEEAQRRHIIAALQRCGGQIEGGSGAAALLQINPHTLRARMRKLKINWRDYRQGDSEG